MDLIQVGIFGTIVTVLVAFKDEIKENVEKGLSKISDWRKQCLNNKPLVIG
jgi:hypothetical protein